MPPRQLIRRAGCRAWDGAGVRLGTGQSKGYALGNVVPCCGRCNAAKNTMSVAEFKAWVRRVHVHLGRASLDAVEALLDGVFPDTDYSEFKPFPVRDE